MHKWIWLKMIQFSKYIIFLLGFVSQGVLNEDPKVWLDGAGPANTCIPPSFLGNVPVLPHAVLTHPQSMYANIQKIKLMNCISMIYN